MKPILFANNETDFTTNGIGRLDCISCKVVEERNGMYELEAEIPITGLHASDIEKLSIIGVVPHEGGNVQAFVVYKITKPINGRFMVYARHISYRLSDIPCTPFSIESSPQACAQALAGLKSHAVETCPFNFTTDVTTGNPYIQKTPASIRQRLGGVEGSILDQFGGEYEWDNWNVHLWKQRGRLANITGITLRYGKNITDINQEEEIANTATGVVPFWIDTDGNNLVMLPEVVVYSQYASNYPYHLTQILDLSSEFQDKPTQAQLRSVAQIYVTKDGFGEPKVSIKVSFVDLWKSEEYKDIAPLEQVQLCDEITVDFNKLGIKALAKVVKTDYDVLRERYNSIEVGSIRTTLAQAVTDRDKDIDTAFVNELTRVNTAISNATAWLTSANGYVVAVKNNDGSWKELFLMNTNNPQTATQGIRFNNNGLGFFNKVLHPDGNILSGPYDMAWTIDGRLGDFANKNYWNFINGEFSLSATATVGGKTVDAIAQEKADAAEQAAENTAAAALAAQVAIYDGEIADLQNQIDGNVTTWYYSGAPTLNNPPANSWTTTTDKDNHIGDIYYDSATGYAYRFMKDGNNYVWTKISDSDIEAALAEAQDAWDLADNKRRIFVSQPVPPYDVGDLWVEGSNGDIKRCATAKTDTQTYNASDWVLASKYTDDSALTSWISGTYTTDKTNLQSQIDSKAETWYQSADPSSAWTTEALKNQHIGDLWYKTTDDTTWYYTKEGSIYKWVQQNVPTAVFDKIDGKAQIFTSQPAPPYNVGDLWCVGSTGDILTCVTARATGNYTATDWEKRNKYTDDTAVNNLNTALTQQEIFNRLTNNGETQGIYLSNNKLYINASYIAAGVIADAAGKFSLNMTTGALTMNSGLFKGEINVNNNFLVNSSGDMTAKSGSFGALKIDSSNTSVYAEGVITLMDDDITLDTSGADRNYNYDLIIDTAYFSTGTYIGYEYSTFSGVNSDELGTVSLYRYYEDGSISSRIEYITVYALSTFQYQFNEYMYSNSGMYLLRFNLKYHGVYRTLKFTITTTSTMKSLLFSGDDGIVAPSIKGTLRGKVQASDFSCGGWRFEGRNKKTLFFGEDGSTENYIRLDVFYGLTMNYSVQNYRMNVGLTSITRVDNGVTWYAQFYQGSDRRIKENIKPIDTDLSVKFIDKTEPKSFTFIHDKGTHYGMIAQEARAVLDELGEEDARLEHELNISEMPVENMRTIEYVEYIPHLINYVKDLRETVNRQQAEIDELKEIVKRLSV